MTICDVFIVIVFHFSRETLDFQKAEAVTRILASLPEEDKRAIGYQVNDMLFYCRYKGRICNISRYVLQLTTKYPLSYYIRQRSWANVMYSSPFVCLFVCLFVC